MCAQGKSVACKSFMTREASATGRARGITALAVNNSSSKLLASSADHHIYMFDCIVPEREPTMYSGHVNNSFYVKSTFSPDGRFIMSGSTDNHVYIWDVASPLTPPLRLKGHTGEVSDVAWSPTEFWKLASSSDDTTVRVWTVDRAMGEHLRSRETQLDLQRREGLDGDVVRPASTSVYNYREMGHGTEAGGAELHPSWSQPTAEEDVLTCHETMMFSDMTSSSQEPDLCEEDRSSTSAALGGGGGAESPTGSSPNGMHLRPDSPFSLSLLDGEVNGGAAQNTTPNTVVAKRTRGFLQGVEDRGRDCRSPTWKQRRLTDFMKVSGEH